MSSKKTRVAHRSAITGQFVKPAHAKRSPNTTVTERNPVGKRKK